MKSSHFVLAQALAPASMALAHAATLARVTVEADPLSPIMLHRQTNTC